MQGWHLLLLRAAPMANRGIRTLFVGSYLTFEAVEGGRLKNMTLRLIVLESFQQPLPLVQVGVCLQRSQLCSQQGSGRQGPPPRAPPNGKSQRCSGTPTTSAPRLVRKDLPPQDGNYKGNTLRRTRAAFTPTLSTHCRGRI